jgi:hypothetical protein
MTAQPMIKRLRQLARPQAVALPSEVILCSSPFFLLTPSARIVLFAHLFFFCVLISQSPVITFVAPDERKQNRAEELLTSHVEGISPMHCTAEPVGADEADFAALGVDPPRASATAGAAAATTPFTLVRVVPRDHLGRQIEALAVAMVSVLLFTVTFYANRAHNLTRSP